ncbi:MCE family protein [Nocardia sp. 2]|uniref:MCE family protein n=1 Tax=Nocardia acididurans TaxID=2802282 RepID=A0ABS1MH69_9NOCA|nr:MlaD family protein [Nocardia acididurans]MBL1079405.1 MCE family protein [Nocardia acididurans]
MKPSSLASVASIFVILVFGGAYLAFGVVGVHWFRDRVEATMTVPESGGLLPRSKVLLSGVQVGQVTSVTHVGAGVEVRFRVDGDHRIPLASKVRIEGLSGLGESYLDFRPETAAGPYLRDGQTVAADKVTAPRSIPDIARTTTELLRQLNPEALASIVDTFGTALSGTETVVPQLSRATDLLAATLLARTDIIREMLLAMQSRATDMDWTGPALRGAAGPWADFGPRVAEVADSIARVIRAGDAPDSFLEENGETIGLVPFLRETTERLDLMGPEFAPLWPMLAPVLAQAPALVSRVDLGGLIAQALHATSDDGALHLQIAVK